jgi:hypothetical protein
LLGGLAAVTGVFGCVARGEAARECPPDAACPNGDRDAQREGVDVRVGSTRDAALDTLRPLADAPGLWLVPGEQGLQHVWLALDRGRGFDPVGTRVRVQLLRARDGEPLGAAVVRRAFVADPRDPTRVALAAVRVVVVDAADPVEYCSVLDGGAVDVVVDLDDGAGAVAHREARSRVLGLDPRAPAAVRQAWTEACARGAP